MAVVVVVVVVVIIVYVVSVVVLNVDVVVQVTPKVDLKLHSMKVEFLGGGWWCGMNSNNRVKPNSVEFS